MALLALLGAVLFEIFQQHFRSDMPAIHDTEHDLDAYHINGTGELLTRFGGLSFNRGLYRVTHPRHVAEWHLRVAAGFPDFADNIACFGYDWLGRVFAIDRTRLEGVQSGVVMLEPGTGEALEIPCTIETFHDDELVNYSDAALASGFYKTWLESGGAQPQHEQCIGYKIPLFLGGTDDIENLELSDISVYWHVMSQMLSDRRIS